MINKSQVPYSLVLDVTKLKKVKRNTLVQLLALYTDSESHKAQRHRPIDGRTDRQTDRQDSANSQSYRVAVRSAKIQ